MKISDFHEVKTDLEILLLLNQCLQNNDPIGFEKIFPFLEKKRFPEFFLENVIKKNWKSTTHMLLENAGFVPTQASVKQAILHPDGQLFQLLLPRVYRKGVQHPGTFFLEVAIDRSDWGLFEQLLDYFNPNAQHCKLLFEALSQRYEPNSEAIFRLFDLAKQHDPRHLDAALILAVRLQKTDILSVLFEKSPPNKKIDQLIVNAAEQENVNVTQLLLNYQPKISAIQQAFIRAANYNHWNVVQYYLDQFTQEELNVAHIEHHTEFSYDLDFQRLQSLLQHQELQQQTPAQPQNRNRPRL